MFYSHLTEVNTYIIIIVFLKGQQRAADADN